MSQEIVFTSARHGLRTGSTGFCTVRSTRGMPGNLAQLLERLTGYSHVFDAYSNQANLNPVNFAHYIARLGDQSETDAPEALVAPSGRSRLDRDRARDSCLRQHGDHRLRALPRILDSRDLTTQLEEQRHQVAACDASRAGISITWLLESPGEPSNKSGNEA